MAFIGRNDILVLEKNTGRVQRMAFDPKCGDLWLQENGDDSFTEIKLEMRKIFSTRSRR